MMGYYTHPRDPNKKVTGIGWKDNLPNEIWIYEDDERMLRWSPEPGGMRALIINLKTFVYRSDDNHHYVPGRSGIAYGPYRPADVCSTDKESAGVI